MYIANCFKINLRASEIPKSSGEDPHYFHVSPPNCNFWIHPWNGKIRAEVSCPPKNMPSPTPMCLCPLTTGMIRPVSSPQFDKCCFSGILTYVMGCLSAEPGKAWNSIFNIPGLEKIEFWTRGLQKLASFFCVIKNQKKILTI